MSILKVRFAEDCRNSEAIDHCADSREARKAGLESMAEEIRMEGTRRAQVQHDVVRAERAFECFHRLVPGSSSEAQVSRSSAGLNGWLKFANILECEANAVPRGPLQGLMSEDPQLAKFIAELEGSEEVADLMSIVPNKQLACCHRQKKQHMLCTIAAHEKFDRVHGAQAHANNMRPEGKMLCTVCA